MSDALHTRIAAEAAGLASLPAGDPERVAAYSHAHGCDACARALAEGEALLHELDELPAPAPPSPEVLARVAASVLAEMNADAARVAAAPGADALAQRRWLAVAPPIGVATAWVALLALARHRAPDRRLWVESAVGIALASAAAAGALSLRALAVGTLVLLSGVFTLVAGHGGPLAPLVGLHCAFIELASAALPLAAVAYVALRQPRGSAGQGPAYYAATSAAGALAGQAALHLSCPVHDALPHLVVFHLGAVALSALLGAGVERVVRARAA